MQALTFDQVQQAIVATQNHYIQREPVDPVQLRAELEARGAVATRAARSLHHFAVDVSLDDVAIRDAALQILRTEIGSSAHRLDRVLGQCDPRIREAIQALIARRGLPREAA